MIKNVTKDIEGYLTSLTEHPERLVGSLFWVPTYQAAVRELAEMLLNAFAVFFNYEDQLRMTAYAFLLFKRENPGEPAEVYEWRSFIRRLRKDIAARMNFEMQQR